MLLNEIDEDDIVKKITESSLQQLSTVIQSISATNGGRKEQLVVDTDVTYDAIKELLQNNWKNVKRYYVALVSGKVNKTGEIKSYLKETKTLLTYSSKDKTGKLAITKYKPIEITDKYSLLEIQILTGRKNQIRVHMQDIGHPIVGDKKYNPKYNSVKQMCLTANKLEFVHPITKKDILLEISIPKEYINLISKR